MKKKAFAIRKSVFIPLCAIYICVTLLGIFVPEAFAAAENAIVNFAAGWFGWLYQLIVIAMVVISVWVLVSKKVGSIRIGGENAKPIMSKWNWFAVSLCSTIATGIVFWGIAEPITHYMNGIPGLVEGAGFGILAGFTPGAKHWFIITVVIVVTFIVSSYTGVSRGMRWLSDKNTKIYFLLLIYVFFCCQTKEILAMTTESMGFFAQNWIVQNTYLGVMTEGTATSMWPTWWTINYWSFLIAYTPLLGMFLAKIAQGRTLREFSLFNFILPGGFSMIWFGIFGSAAIYKEASGAGIYDAMQTMGTEASVFAFFKDLPLGTILSVIFMFTAFLSVVTLCDSMTTTIASITVEGDGVATEEPPARIKVFWGVVMASLAFVNILVAGITGNTSGINATKLLAITCAFPLLFLVVVVVISCAKMLMQLGSSGQKE